MSRRQEIEDYVTEQTALSRNDQIARALEGRLVDPLNTDETVQILLKTVKALYHVNLYLADQIDRIETR